MKKKAGFAVVFIDITIRGVLPEEVSIHTAKVTAIKIELKEIHKKEELYIVHQIEQRKSPNIT